MDAAATAREITPDLPEPTNSLRSIIIAIIFEVVLASTQQFYEFIESMQQWCTVDYISEVLNDSAKKMPKYFIKTCQAWKIKPLHIIVPTLILILYLSISTDEGYRMFYIVPMYKTLYMLDIQLNAMNSSERDKK